MELKDLAGHSSALAPVLGVTPAQVNLMLEFLGKKKIAKPDVEFKASVPNMAKPGKKPFLFVEEEKGSFFFYNCDFRMLKKDIEPKLKKAEKSLKSAKDGEKELLEAEVAFLSLCLDRIKKKKWLATSGKIAYKSTNSETNECFMSLEGKVEGPRKSSMHTVLAELDFKDKNGNILRVLGGLEDKVVEETTGEQVEEKIDNNGVEDKNTPTREEQIRAKKLEKMENGIGQMAGVVGRAPKDKLLPNIEKYELALAKLKEEANADGTITKEEQEAIDKAEQALKAVREQVESGSTDTNERTVQRAKNKAKIRKYKAQLDQLAKRLGIR